MTADLFALIPFSSACFYLALMVVTRRKAPVSSGSRGFLAYLTLMMVWTGSSALWRVAGESWLAEPTLRVLVLTALLAPAGFLYFAQAQYPARWAARTRSFIAMIIALTVFGTVSGAFTHTIVGETTTPATWEMVTAYSLLALNFVAYLFSFAYLIFAFRTNRDPFERNRLKYLGIAAALIMLGGYTNVISPVFQRIPVDQGINAGGAAIIALTLARYRLDSMDVIVRRTLGIFISGFLIISVYLGLLMGAHAAADISLYSRSGFAFALAMSVLMGPVGYLVRSRTMSALDRMMVSGHLSHYDALLELGRQISGVMTLGDLTRHVTELFTSALDSSYVAMLLPKGGEQHYELARVSGPFPRPQPDWMIRAENQVVKLIVQAGVPVTPAHLERLVHEDGVSDKDRAQFIPYQDAILYPVISRGEAVGLIAVGPKIYNRPYALEDMDLISTVAGQAAIALDNARLFEQVQQRAETDFLTGLPNHRYLQDLFDRTLEEASRTGQPFSVAMSDIDNFKLLNDVHGHQAGDDALRRIATVLRAALRPGDTIGRYGGDEFFFILPGTSKTQAEEIMGRVERALRKTALQVSGLSNSIPMRITWGVSSYPTDGSTRRSLISLADASLLEQRYKLHAKQDEPEGRQATTQAIIGRHPEKLKLARTLLDLIDQKDSYTREHSQQDAALSLVLSDELGLPEREKYALWLGALLHDVGKIGTPIDILRKPSGLTPDERVIMQNHVTLGESIANGLFDIPEAAEVVAYHHERFDGGGYPRGLKEMEIPKLARMLNVVDAFSAMVHDRPYRKGLSKEDAIAELRRNAGTQFDPEMVEAFARAMQGGRARRVA